MKDSKVFLGYSLTNKGTATVRAPLGRNDRPAGVCRCRVVKKRERKGGRRRRMRRRATLKDCCACVFPCLAVVWHPQGSMQHAVSSKQQAGTE